MNSKSSRYPRPEKPEPEALRTRYNMAVRMNDGDYKTGFERVRAEAGVTQADMAKRMSYSLADYIALETGTVRPTVDTIMDFCTVMDLHPLDLYNQTRPGADVNLPRGSLPPVIVEALFAVAYNAHASLEDRTRAVDRLRDETERAARVLEMHYDSGLHFLNLAEGDNIPGVENASRLYEGLTEKCEGLRRFLSLHDERREIEATLNMFALEMEQNIEDQSALSDRIRTSFDENYERMLACGFALFGDRNDGFHQAYQRVVRAAEQQGFAAVRKMVEDEPARLFKDGVKMPRRGKDVTVNGQKMGPAAAASLFVDCVESHLALAVQGKASEAAAAAYEKTLDDFHAWRKLKKTSILLAWYENYRLIDPRDLNDIDVEVDGLRRSVARSAMRAASGSSPKPVV